MSTTSYNGWPASTDRASIGVEKLFVRGVEIVGGVRRGDVALVLGHVLGEFHDRVEPLRNPGCWGYSFRKNRNANNLSCHSSATAVDANAPKHPNGIPARRNFSPVQINEIHRILREIEELDEVVHWGGDWVRVPDPMHFEIHDHDLAKLARVAGRIRAGQTQRQEPKVNRVQAFRAAIEKVLRDYPIPADRPAARSMVSVIRTALKVGPKA